MRLALPVVVQKAAPVLFREWWPGIPMANGIWNIPVPAAGDPVAPDVLLVPVVGFDRQNYRLGYGGGYYDRTLAAATRPRTIGVGFELARIATIHPQPHDIPMDFVVTEAGVHAAGGEGLQRVDPEESRRRMQRLLIARRLPRAAHPESYSSPVCYAGEFPGYFGDKQ
jgi:hypothetical protein